MGESDERAGSGTAGVMGRVDFPVVIDRRNLHAAEEHVQLVVRSRHVAKLVARKARFVAESLRPAPRIDVSARSRHRVR
jgi:hypothetical protein